MFTTVKLIGAVVLIVLGLQGLLARKASSPPPPPGTALRAGLVTSLANPKLAVFFVALFPQFVPDGAPVLPSALAMAGMVVALDLVWYSTLAYGVARTRRRSATGRGCGGGAVHGWRARGAGCAVGSGAAMNVNCAG